MKKTTISAALFLAFAGGLVFLMSHRTVAAKFDSPSGKHDVTISYRTYLSYLPAPPGSSSDKPCFVKIVGKDGLDYGEIPVPMLQNVDLEWTPSGARIKLVGEWDFERRTCYYWSDDGNRMIFVKK